MRNLLERIAYSVEHKVPYRETMHLTKRFVNQESDAALAACTQWHPNGFGVITLGRVQPDRHVRIHLWPPGARTKQQPHWSVHKHVDSFTSLVMFGALTNILYSVSPEAEGENQYYVVGGPHGDSTLTKTPQRVRSKMLSRQTYYAGDYYEIKEGDHHAVEIDDTVFVATVVITRRGSTQAPLVVGDVNGLPEYFHRHSLNKSREIALALRGLREQLTVLALDQCSNPPI